MGNKKIFEFLNLLSVLVRTGEINLKSYAATTGFSERTLRRYFADLREFFGAENFILTERGNVGITDKNLLSSLTLPSEKEKLSFKSSPICFMLSIQALPRFCRLRINAWTKSSPRSLRIYF